MTDTTSQNQFARTFDVFAEDYVADPYPIFAVARDSAPVFYSEKLGYWVISRFADIREVLRNPRAFSAANSLAVPPVCPAAAQRLFESGLAAIPTLTDADPPDHTRVRRLTNQAFTLARVQAMRTHVCSLVRSALARLHGGRADLVKDLTWELPPRTVYSFVGIPEEDIRLFRTGIDHPLQVLWGNPSEGEQLGVAEGMAAFWRYTETLVERRREHPTDDFTSALLQARWGELAPLTNQEACSIIFNILGAGHETTTSLLTHGLQRLLHDRKAWEAIRLDPALIPNAVEEVLRIDPSVVAWRRITTEQVTIAGTAIPAQAPILLLLGSGNRDPEMFESPDSFDIYRKNARGNLAFGFGIHFCLGAPLARLEAEVVFAEVPARFPTMRLAKEAELTFPPNLLFRAPKALLVQWDDQMT